jgi:hypothetical protein
MRATNYRGLSTRFADASGSGGGGQEEVAAAALPALMLFVGLCGLLMWHWLRPCHRALTRGVV